MRKTHMIALGALSLFNLPAEAATLYTPPLNAVTPDRFKCSVVNVSRKELLVELSIYSSMHLDSGPILLDNPRLRPGEIFDMKVGGGSAPEGIPSYCKFKVINGSAKDVRALGSVYTTDGSDKVTIPAN